MKRIFVLGIAAFAALVIAAPARAVTISFVPTSTTVDVGDSVDIDVVISGLALDEEIVSAFDLDVDYDLSIVNATGVTFGPYLGLPPDEVFQDFFLSPGFIDFFAVSSLKDNELAILQPDDSFVLATLSFDALAPGTTALIFDPVKFPGVLVVGRADTPLDVTALPGEIIVRGPISTPEPSTLWLGLVGLFAARELRRRRAR
jgi:hypothetical protein